MYISQINCLFTMNSFFLAFNLLSLSVYLVFINIHSYPPPPLFIKNRLCLKPMVKISKAEKGLYLNPQKAKTRYVNVWIRAYTKCQVLTACVAFPFLETHSCIKK